MGNVTLELVFSWNIDSVFSLNLFVSGTASGFKNRNIVTVACGPVCVIFTKMFAMEFKLEATNSFMTFGVVTNDFDVCFLADVVLISIKDDFRLAMRCSHSKKASNFIFQTELKLSGWKNYGWSEDVDVR